MSLEVAGISLYILIAMVVLIAMCYFIWIGTEDVLVHFGIDNLFILIVVYIALFGLSAFIPGFGIIPFVFGIFGIIDYFNLIEAIK